MVIGRSSWQMNGELDVPPSTVDAESAPTRGDDKAQLHELVLGGLRNLGFKAAEGKRALRDVRSSDPAPKGLKAILAHALRCSRPECM